MVERRGHTRGHMAWAHGAGTWRGHRMRLRNVLRGEEIKSYPRIFENIVYWNVGKARKRVAGGQMQKTFPQQPTDGEANAVKEAQGSWPPEGDFQ